MNPTEVVKLRKCGEGYVLTVPVAIFREINCRYLHVQLDKNGRIIYTPLRELNALRNNDPSDATSNRGGA